MSACPFADTGLTKIPDGVSDERALFVGDVLATGYWAVRISGQEEGDTVLVLGAGPVGLCAAACAKIKLPCRMIICEKREERRKSQGHSFPRRSAFRRRICPK